MKKIVNKWKVGNRDEIYSPAINAKGFLNDIYGINGKEENKTKFPSHSFPLWWKKINGSKSYAIMLESFDAMSNIGFPFICWVAVNIKENELTDNQSILDFVKWRSTNSPTYGNDILWQGHNSSVMNTKLGMSSKTNKFKSLLPEECTSETIENSCMYHGPSPMDQDGLYLLTVYGLDVEADQLEYIDDFEENKKEKLNKPFFAGDMLSAINSHVVGSWTIAFKYKNNNININNKNEFKSFVSSQQKNNNKTSTTKK